MSITARDRKIMLVLAPLVLVLVYWFLILGPKRDEASKLGKELTSQEQKRDDAKATADRLTGAQASFRTQFASVVRLGKAIPSTVDMPGVIVQLDKAARGTGIHFSKIAAGARVPAAAPAATGSAAPAAGGSATSGSTAATPQTGSTNPSAPAAPGGQPAQSAPGSVVENAGNKVNDANQKEASRGLDPGDTQTSQAVRPGALPVGGGDPSKTVQPGAADSGAAASGAPGLDTVPLELTFRGGYFDLADFLHRLKRFVRVANDRILVGGRLLTIDAFDFANADGKLTTNINATVYLVPKDEGVAAGATPNGPGATSTPVSNPGSGGAATPPAPAVTP